MSFEFNHIELKNILNYLKIQSVRNYHQESKYYLNEIIFDDNDICNDNDVFFLRKYKFQSDNNN